MASVLISQLQMPKTAVLLPNKQNNYIKNSAAINFKGAQINGETFKSANIFNVSKLVDLYADYRIGAGYPKQAENKKKLYKFVIKQLSLPGRKIIMLKQEGKYVGFIHLSTYYSTIDSMRSGVIEGLYVRPEFRKKGRASNLITQAKNWVSNKKYKGLFVKTINTNEKAKKIYIGNEFKDETKRNASFFWNNYKAFDGNR